MECSGVLAILGTGIVLAIGFFLWWLRKNDAYWEKRGIPYTPRQGVISMLVSMRSRPLHEIFMELHTKYGRIYGGFEFRTPVLTVCDPVLLKDILVKDFHIFNFRRDVKIGDDIFEKTIFFAKGEDWKRVRSIVTPAFTSRRMRQVAHIINEGCSNLLETFEKYSESQKPVDVKSVLGAFTMDVIAHAAFATRLDSHKDPNNIFVRNVKTVFFQSLWQQIIFLLVPTWITVTFKLGKNMSMEFFKGVTLQVIEERKKSGKKYDDILQLFLDAQEDDTKLKLENKDDDETDQFGSIISEGPQPELKSKKLSQDELIAQCVLFFIAGYDTTASTLAFMAYELALNPECQEKLINEVDQAFEKHKKFDHDVVRDMKYLDCVVTETLRMYPFLLRSERTATTDYKLANTDLVIEKGTLVGFNFHCLHYDPEFFPNPEKFHPERFFPENATHPPYSYLPFGAGPRNCLGMRFALMKMKICMSNILKNFRLKKAHNTKVPLDFQKGQGFLRVETLPLMVEKRK